MFGVTSFWDIESGIGDLELKQGKNLVDACKEDGIGFFVWSSLPNASGISGGKVFALFVFTQPISVALIDIFTHDLSTRT